MGSTARKSATMLAAVSALAIVGRASGAAPSAPQESAGVTAGAVRAAFAFRDTPVDDVLAALARTYGVVVLKDEALPMKISVATARPATRIEAEAALNDALLPLGYTVKRSVGAESGRPILQVMMVADVQKSGTPITTGTDAKVIDISQPERHITHVLPLLNGDMIRAALAAAARDPELSLDIRTQGGGGQTAALTGPAVKVRALVTTLAALAPTAAPTLAIKTRRVEGDGAAAVRLVNELGSQADASGRAYATLDRRTNTVIVTGPPAAVEAALAALDKVERNGQNAAAQTPATTESSPGRGERPVSRSSRAGPIPSSTEPEKTMLDPRKEQLGGSSVVLRL